MASPQENISMAVFCDFENVALGVRDAKIDRFDIKPVLERLLLKGSIVVKKAYCDWERYKGFKAAMHEASFELIEIPHVRQSGKNSADIRLVVDALDLCYTKSHVDTFVIVSGDSDFSPLVSKLRENAKKVIGVGVKHSTSDLLVANCDEFIFYDDLVRELERDQHPHGKGKNKDGGGAKRQGGEERQPRQDGDERKSKAVAFAIETLDALVLERGESGKIWASVLKSAIKRRRPDFNETRYGFRAFGNLLEEAQSRGLLEVGRDDKSGTWVSRLNPPPLAAAAVSVSAPENTAARAEEPRGRRKGRRNGRGGGAADVRETAVEQAVEAQGEIPFEPVEALAQAAHRYEAAPPFSVEPFDANERTHAPQEAYEAHVAPEPAADVEPAAAAPARARKTAARKSPARKRTSKKAAETPASAVDEPASAAVVPAEPAAKKAPSRARRARSKAAAEES
ncbi:NYN domain-containing protein [Paraburkholderia sp. CNPSo 3272]|uniref:NYN domain-containing protein n=1 Tax=Paraburkholderia sp. CNPSo 3272 TaxID=2940931 RepID=UPI0020B720B6|nr:NYN domain-containing protein [Paraburkholderia sp. CNPSo 3272]MCP3721947.1 NYN domain-containing protein [Paraburkholderia sp. CNPSo 3272]